MPARVQGLVFALGSAKQTNISTIGTTYNTFLKLNTDVPYLLAHTETDAPEIGKSTEFINNVYLTNKEPAPQRIEKYGSAEWMCWAWAYAMGTVSVATGLYTIHPLDIGVSLELPYWTLAAKLAEGGGMAFDEAQIGNSIESVETTFRYGPGRDSVKTTIEFVGSGHSAVPSGVVYPTAPLTEHYARSSGMSININGQDYVSTKTLLAGTMTWRNNLILPMRYFPGSGYDSDGFAIGGRTMVGTRECGFTFTAFLTSASTEYQKLVAQTAGSATVTLTFDATHYVTWNYPVVTFQMVERVVEEGIIAVTVTVAPHYDPTAVGGVPNNVLVVTSKNALTDIAQ
jgi:hypothetical protein